ncbi:hypothetical protein HPB51_029503 [Rhipicephalus microplus]|uniref:Tick transposon n=1 Tax=Rhipicephalus microplus TaxID=6941 RepID=A0A9J6CUH8_RHIMP|nr:hypothetical protein HPB51_029503 [Rhipicephalus microplus]
MIEFHWKLQLRLLRDLVDKVRVSATSNVHVAEGICLPDFVLEVLGLGPKFAVQPQKNKPELVSIVRQVSKRVPEDQATRIINEEGICLPDFVLEVLGLGPKFAVQPQKNKPELVSIVRQVSKRVPEDQATRIINEGQLVGRLQPSILPEEAGCCRACSGISYLQLLAGLVCCRAPG